MNSVTQVSHAAVQSGAVNIRTPSTTVAQSSVPTSANTNNQQQPTLQQVQHAVKQANAKVADLNENISFGFVKELGQLVVQVTNNTSGEVIRQFPSKEFIAQQIAAKAALGMLLDKLA